MRIYFTIYVAFVLSIVGAVCFALPVLDSSSGIDNQTIEDLEASVNDTPKNVYVVKAVFYEVGILTEVDDNETSFESQERVDLTFYDTHSNDSHIDLGNIPLPIQTNVTGQVLTGIAPVNIGAFSSPSELLETLPLTGTIVNITHSDTAFYKLTRSNSSDSEKPHLLQTEELAQLPQVANLFTANHEEQQNSDNNPSNSLESKENN